MQLARFRHNGQVRIGTVSHNGQRTTVAQLSLPPAHDPMIGLIAAQLRGEPLPAADPAVALDAVELLAPIVAPRKNVLCVGKNYVAHAAEFSASGFDSTGAGESIPTAPIIFSKAPCTLAGAHADIEVPWELTSQVDYEGELGVVIGRPGRSIAAADAYQHVFGYTVINDVTARDLQARHKQWLLGKSIDTFCPMGPWLTTADEVDPSALELRCDVNGELRQHASTRDLIFDIPAIIAAISASMTLETGDVIATGTPAGVGIGFDPPRFLAPGDRVTVSISGLGQISNVVR